MRILTINSGSSSVKYSVYDLSAVETLLTIGKLDTQQLANRKEAMQELLKRLGDEGHMEGVTAAGFRVVHGGRDHVQPERITPRLLEDLKELVPLAPDHLPDAVEAVEAVRSLAPHLALVACFDTAFHATLPRVAKLYGLTRELADAGVIRYGFHGLSYQYLVEELRKEGVLPRRLIIAHLGNGASMAAIRDGVSVDTSMGLTPTGGFMMSSRSGDLDPGVILHLIRQKGMSPDEVNELVAKKGGLKGLSGISADMRDLEKSEDPRAAEAIDCFVYQIRRFLGAYMLVLGGLDLLVFAGGIGENSRAIRDRVSEGIAAPIRVMVTNEELMIARQTQTTLG